MGQNLWIIINLNVNKAHSSQKRKIAWAGKPRRLEKNKGLWQKQLDVLYRSSYSMTHYDVIWRNWVEKSDLEKNHKKSTQKVLFMKLHIYTSRLIFDALHDASVHFYPWWLRPTLPKKSLCRHIMWEASGKSGTFGLELTDFPRLQSKLGFSGYLFIC